MKFYKFLASAILLAVLSGVFAGWRKSEGPQPSEYPADLVIFGKIFTPDRDRIVDAFAVKDGKFVYVGAIEIGKYADFVVLDKNVLELEKTDKMDIFNTKVISTWFEGQMVYPR